jgi:hypothetical protein
MSTGSGSRREHQMPFRPGEGIPVTHANTQPRTSIQASGCSSISRAHVSTSATAARSAGSVVTGGKLESEMGHTGAPIAWLRER